MKRLDYKTIYVLRANCILDRPTCIPFVFVEYLNTPFSLGRNKKKNEKKTRVLKN